MSEQQTPGLRERKKEQTRATLLRVAESLFETRGYEHVTVAEIADAANISVKTLFTYFRSKEDLAFGAEHELRDALVGAIRSRGVAESPVDAVAALLSKLVEAPSRVPNSLESFHTMVGDSLALRSRLRRMWEDYEDALAAALADDFGGRLGAAEAHLASMALVAMVRSFTTVEVRALAGRARSGSRRRAALQEWIDSARSMIGDGVSPRTGAAAP